MKQPVSDEWIVVMNSSAARVLTSTPEPHHPAEIAFEIEHPRQKPQDVMADKPGRSFSSGAAGRRSALEPHGDLGHLQDVGFAKELIDRLEQHRQAGEFETLTLVASPRMLGVMRDTMPPDLAQKVTRVISRNFAALSIPMMQEKLSAVLARH
ncbi:host attachment protein [Thioclava atlantica]|uniref:Host attachment protein n=1 Tax=Thioclava atlantica TaxID=1317124 RepID=A0A085TT36_9RHOB|nr:host attachment protein [Thioclava atlantica]KFE33883.1 hypothetical protein DW2_15495 [Thioclava atlantica]